MPTLVNYSGKDELRNESAFCANSMVNVDVFGSACKRARISAPFVLWDQESEQATRSSINVLPDECLFEIFRRMAGKERSISACVSKQWLTLLSRIRRAEICNNDTAMVSEDKEVDGCLTRSVEGKKATDTRLAAIAVGTAARGGLGKLSIRGSNSTHGVTNAGLLAIARGCPSLKSLSLWNVSSIGDEGLSEVAKECHMLEKLDFSQCPSITNKGLIAIAENCPNLTTLSIESCPRIGNDSMQAIAQGCPKLESISIKDCPLVGDQGLASLFSSNSSIVSKVKLQNLNISDFSLVVIGHYGKSITSLTLSNLKNVTERGFSVMGNAQGLKALVSLSISSCFGVTDFSIEAIGKGCSALKQIYLRNGCFMSDNGILAFSKSAEALESMHLEGCNRITLPGLVAALSSCSFKFRSLSLVKCMGLKDVSFQGSLLLYPCISLRCLSIKNCPAFGSAGLSILGKMCPSLRQVDLSGLYGMSDEGIISLLESSVAGLAKLNLSGCINLSDESVLAVARLHGETIKELNLDGCRKISDMSLVVISDSCPLLNDLDVSNSAVTDSGIAALSCSEQLNLQILSISGCSRISNKSLPYLIQLGKSLVGLNLQHCNSLSSSGVDMLMGNLWKCDILC
ncbi:EIN3-binding F-box protein 1-like [Chenopodium quinoa]|uniref:EIN3-binding F-box protein 1 n=1 Tax=Chenopodium quinoa TaxID=63459 RepID=A0A803LHA0_CHEQI|nr:EIN3-binding F-box protein 1-like [Chenopodium quinoa]